MYFYPFNFSPTPQFKILIMNTLNKLFGLFACFFFVLIANISLSQNATLRGFVYDKDNGEPIIYTNVYFKGTSIGATTDVNGYYAINQVPPGTYELMVTFIGYDTLKMEIRLQRGEVKSQNLYISPSARMLDVVNISAEKHSAQTDSRISVVTVTPIQIKQLPSIGGQPDIAQYLQVIPGIVFTGDQGGQLYIRGGSPVQNRVLLDGMTIYNPFHSIGLFSVFDTDIIRSADIFTGGFGAEYGGRISSVMDIRTRDGNRSRIAGKVSASPFGANLLLEGPLTRTNKEKLSPASFILSAKNSYLAQTSKIFYKYIDKQGLPFNYTDLYGKATFTTNNGSKVNFFGFNYSDNVTYQSLNEFNWNNFGLGSNFIIIPEGFNTLIQGYLSYSNYIITQADVDEKPRSSDVDGFNLGFDFTYYIGNADLKWGVDVSGYKTNLEVYNSANRHIKYKQNTTEAATYVKLKWLPGSWVIEPSLRFHYYASLSEGSLEPRLAGKYNFNEFIRFKFAAGKYTQNLLSATSNRDVVNLFYGFLSGPDNLQRTFDGKEITSRLQSSNHAIVGFEYDFWKRYSINIEGYYKEFTQLSNLNSNKVFDDSPEYINQPDYLKKDFIIETGDAYGIDFVLKYDWKDVYVWAVYSYGFINRYDGVIEYQPHYDRRHNINLVTSYNFGHQKSWGVDFRWNFGSGFPFTQVAGYYERLIFDEGIFTDPIVINGDLAWQYAGLNQGRLPSYHRLDASVRKKHKFNRRSTLETNFSVTNLYNRMNIFYVDRIKAEKVYQMAIMPSLGISLTF